jgi:hypothetical protein
MQGGFKEKERILKIPDNDFRDPERRREAKSELCSNCLPDTSRQG